MVQLEWETRRANVVKQALTWWINAAEGKVKRVGEKAAELGAVHDPTSGWGTVEAMTASMKADIQYINTTLPLRLEEAREALKDITSGARAGVGL